MTKDHGPQIKDDAAYQALREDGASKQKAARIANVRANEAMRPSEKGGHAPAYEEWTVDDLHDRAAEIGVEGRSKMNKHELIAALRGR